jgi:hypothetical protein
VQQRADSAGASLYLYVLRNALISLNELVQVREVSSMSFKSSDKKPKMAASSQPPAEAHRSGLHYTRFHKIAKTEH